MLGQVVAGLSHLWHARAIAQRRRSAIAEVRIRQIQGRPLAWPLQVTVSIGVAPAPSSLEEALSSADQAL